MPEEAVVKEVAPNVEAVLSPQTSIERLRFVRKSAPINDRNYSWLIYQKNDELRIYSLENQVGS